MRWKMGVRLSVPISVMIITFAAPGVIGAAPDLALTNITKPTYIFANMTNTFEITIENVGSENADAFNTTLYVDGNSVDTETVPALDMGSSVLIELDWTPQYPGEYVIEVMADSSDDVAEENETNNTEAMAVTVIKNGYIGDKPLTTHIHGTASGDLIYTWGDSYYSSVIYPKDSGNTPYGYDVLFELTLPEGAAIKAARLYNYWTWSHLGSSGAYPDMYVTFEGYEVPPDSEYTNRKGWGYYDYPTGTYAYDVTSYVSGSGGYTAYIENVASDSRTFCMDGFGLLVIYEHSSSPAIEYWVNEGCDMLSSMGTSGGVDPERATATAFFEGEIELPAVENATLWTVAQSGGNLDDVLFFNDKNWTSAYDGTPYPDLDIDERDVTAWLMSQNNTARVRGVGDYMVPSNAFLILEKKTEYEFPYLHLATPSDVNAGEPFNITVTTYDKLGEINITHTGTVHFVSSDASAFLPADYTFALIDNGVKTFHDVILHKSGNQWVTVNHLEYPSTIPYTNSTTVNGSSLDHFSFETVNSPQTAGVSFNIMIRACDTWNNTATSYTGKAILSDLTGTIDPSESGMFSNGTWTGAVTITKAQKDDVITARDASTGKMGSSNAFEIVCGDLSRIVVSPSSWSMIINDAKQFNATGFDAYNNIISMTPEWSVNGGGIIEDNGLFTAKSVGTWAVYAIYNGISGEATVTVLTINPVVGIIEPVARSTIRGIATVSGNSSSKITEISRVEIRFDNGTWNTAYGTTEWHFEWDTTRVPSGLHRISARAYDGIAYSNVTSIEVYVENIVSDGRDEGKDSLENVLYWVLGLIAVITIVLLLILLFYKKTKKDDGIQRAVCPKCSHEFKVKGGTQEIHCPYCGVIVEIGEPLAQSKNSGQ
ncbi:MAG: DUF3344 domain-containing protein [Thermoplasmata archaeon]|nr:DUF3344 domain-containing protein [Thermoplasmata archaeon]